MSYRRPIRLNISGHRRSGILVMLNLVLLLPLLTTYGMHPSSSVKTTSSSPVKKALLLKGQRKTDRTVTDQHYDCIIDLVATVGSLVEGGYRFIPEADLEQSGNMVRVLDEAIDYVSESVGWAIGSGTVGKYLQNALHRVRFSVGFYLNLWLFFWCLYLFDTGNLRRLV